jgi:hypothetical protein
VSGKAFCSFQDEIRPKVALTQHSCHEVQSSGGQMPTDRTAS